MPVLYVIDPEEKLIRTRCVGDVKLGEVIDHFRTLRQDPACPDRLDVFLDLREITSLPFTGEVSAVAQEIAKTKEKVRFNICAVVATTDALFGMMRMFAVFAEKQFTAIRVFRGAEEAEQWLMSQRFQAR
jgi:hypothetical protein